MTNPINYLRQVQTYQRSALEALQNQNCIIGAISNMKFKNFQNETANLGDAVTYDKPYRYLANPGLDVTFQSSTQRFETITCDKSQNIAPAFSDQEFVFNVDQYMDQIGYGAIAELGAKIESDVASGIVTSAYRFYGDGNTAIDSYEQLAQAVAYMDDYGSVMVNRVGVIPTLAVPPIIADGLNQFAINRNNEIANSWQLGQWGSLEWYRSNLLPVFIAGGIGQAGQTLTFVSIDSTGTQITFSGATPSQANALVEGDLLWFTTSVRYLTFTGHVVSGSPVQVRVTANANASGGGNVVASVYPALSANAAVSGAEVNLSRALTTSDTAKVANSHRRGFLMSGKALYVAMPKLNEKVPYPSSQDIDKNTGVSLRMYYGTEFGKNTMALIHDVIYGYTFTPEYCFAMLFPL